MMNIIKKIEIALSLIFLFLLLLPLIGLVGEGKVRIEEHNTINLIDLIHRIGKAKYTYGENYAFRDRLIKINGLIKTKLFHISSSQKVLMGMEGWLFLADEKALDNHRNIYGFTDDDVRLWKDVLQFRNDFCRELGCSYYFTISPDKSNIYPEFLPDKFYEPVSDLSRRDSLENLMGEWGIDYINVFDSLICSKGSYPLYYKTDTHWNELGAYYAYLAILDSLRRNYPQIRPGDREPDVIIEGVNGGDLARLMGLDDSLHDNLYHVNSEPHATLFNGDKIDLQMIDVQHVGRLHTKNDSGELGKALIFHDSFGVALIPLLAEHFKEAVFIRSDNFDSDFVDEYKPDIVIQQIVERRLLNWKPDRNEIK